MSLITGLLKKATGQLILYPLGDTSALAAKEVAYSSLYLQARQLSHKIKDIDGFHKGNPVLLHFNDHWDNVLWFWAVLLADGLPVMSSPFSNNGELRQKHIEGLSELLQSPICVARDQSLALFGTRHSMHIVTAESLLERLDYQDAPYSNGEADHTVSFSPDSPAMLMLTSGSTGNAKAVKITHRQALAAVAGKAKVRPLHGKPFLNWIGLDHVAALLEIHLQALYLNQDQVHVAAADIVSSPTVFLDLLDRHQVSRTFAPNFFLGRLAATVPLLEEQRAKANEPSPAWDLEHLVILGSGGEANDIETCLAVSGIIKRYGGPSDVILPGFGMTETCAGIIYSKECPSHDVVHGHRFASLGKCIDGVQMRIVLPASTAEESATPAPPGEIGLLEVRGEAVFGGYYRNAEATEQAFTPDGWFRTGDSGRIDAQGYLSLAGRTKDVININGVKFPTAEVQASVEQALGKHALRVVCFPSRAANALTEQVTVAYVPNEWSPETLLPAHDKIVEACLLCTSSQPVVFGLKDLIALPQTSLGKISSAKLRSSFEKGDLKEAFEDYKLAIRRGRSCNGGGTPSSASLVPTQGEAQLLDDFREVMITKSQANGFELEVDVPFYELGFTSIDLIKLKRRIDSRLATSVPVIVLMKNPTVRSLVAVLDHFAPASHQQDSITKGTSTPGPAPYDPVVVLRQPGHKTPLWLVHPGVGEVLVFLGLAQQPTLEDRPVMALRARGFEPGQPQFTSIEEMVRVYADAIQSRQPQGPYALGGYSYGGMVAFELAKELQLRGEEVRFLAIFNLPPEIAWRMRQLNWVSCLFHLCMFLGLVEESWFEERLAQIDSSGSRLEALACVREAASKPRWDELGLDEAALETWSDLAHGLHNLAIDYKPKGAVESMDVFHAVPLKAAAKSRQEWLEDHLSQWQHYCNTTPRFHEVGGAHYTMLGPEHVVAFAKILQLAIDRRGL